MSKQLWHSEIRLPDGFKSPSARVALAWTRHADKARTDDRYAEVPRFDTLPLQAFEVIEVETEGRRVTKIVVRGHMTKTLDAVFVLIPNGDRPWTVKTVWINERNDVHGTLDHSRYVH